MKLVPRPEPGVLEVLLVSVGAVLLAFLASLALLWLYGAPPWEAAAAIAAGVFADPRGFAEVLRRAVPLVLVGAGLALAFRAQFWNIGAEGQLLMGAVAAAGVALFSGLPEPWMLFAMGLSAFLAGGLWAIFAALLKARLGVNDVITTLMQNYVAIYLVDWLIHGPWKGKSAFGFAYTDRFPEAAGLPLLPGTALAWPGVVLALLFAALFAWLLFATKLGFEVRVLGENPEAARYAGVRALFTLSWVALLSGGAAGLAGFVEVAGTHHKLLAPLQISLGYGYTGIIVAWLGRNHPLAAALTGLLVGFVFAAGDVAKVALATPFQLVQVVNGLILFFLIAAEVFLRYRVVLGVRRG